MKSQPIYRETTAYTVLLYRKSRGLRLTEMGLFLAGLLAVLPFLEIRSAPFIGFLLLWGAAVMAGVPALFRVLRRPSYTLFQDRLVFETGGKREEVPLSQVERSFDFPYIYRIKGKKRPLLVSDEFLDALNVQLELNKRGLNADGR